MIGAAVHNAQAILGWAFVIIVVGCWLIWRYYERVKPRRAEFERQWQQRFEPNLPNVAAYPSRADGTAIVDDEYLRLMHDLPDDHLPADWRDWTPRAGAHGR